MRPPPRSIEEWLYLKLLNSRSFNKFVFWVNCKVNKKQYHEPISSTTSYRPTELQKFKAYRILFWDEMRGTFGLKRLTNKGK
ncbi:Mrx7p SCDLUD_005013 [Saccharomycodes ludwigii]|uniref:Mrx7p n=1 Tax=Saccharomycodes ludwigii TaxID=36035 RepID=UPI001E853D11|nr:hypothetical protein SCDLUD_005013 [Saccharomycodes ludwigii]KAH3898690.1 hypothetical protein SCDLUD_005013 [Saccharomycodes ludwigii]